MFDKRSEQAMQILDSAISETEEANSRDVNSWGPDRMKWPKELLLIRHAESAYNKLKQAKDNDPEYGRFCEMFEHDRSNPELRSLADSLHKRYLVEYSDRHTPITSTGEEQARITSRRMRESGMYCPDVIFVSPYLRTEQTLRILQEEWPSLRIKTVYREERIREKDHGLVLLYNDWRIYQVMHPEQGELQRRLGEYDYRYLNRENIPDVRLRNLSWLATLTSDFAGQRVMAVTHHLTILATRANLERLSPQQFLDLDAHERPMNCSVTRYTADSSFESSCGLTMYEYNRQYY